MQRIVAAGGSVECGRVNGGFIMKVVARALTTHHAPGELAPSRAIGDFKYKENDSLQPEKQIVTADPDVLQHMLTDDEEFLILACDGA